MSLDLFLFHWRDWLLQDSTALESRVEIVDILLSSPRKQGAGARSFPAVTLS